MKAGMACFGPGLVATRLLRELGLDAGSNPRRSRKLSAASGLVVSGSFLYVVADDENHLGVFPAQGGGEGTLVRLFGGDLPIPLKARKAHKFDPEALTLLPPFAGYPHGALFAWGSGSRPRRRTGALFKLDSTGALKGEPAEVDLTPLYAGLERRFPELNIEGALVSGAVLVLLQRGSRKQPENACILLPIPAFVHALVHGEAFHAPEALAVQSIELGQVNGTPLSFTDAAALPDGRMVFTCVAENTWDSYEDGPCVGAAVGIIASDGTLQQIQLFEERHKIEGVHARLHGDVIELLLVTDADNETVPALLLAEEIHQQVSAPEQTWKNGARRRL